jgi:hypothetical protein
MDLTMVLTSLLPRCLDPAAAAKGRDTIHEEVGCCCFGCCCCDVVGCAAATGDMGWALLLTHGLDGWNCSDLSILRPVWLK